MNTIVTPWNFASFSFDATPSQRKPMLTVIAEFAICSDRDVKDTVQRARLLATLAELPTRRKTAFGKAVLEVAINSLQYAGGGRVEFRVDTTLATPFIEVAIFDPGKGQAEISTILNQAAGPDCGLRRSVNAVDRLLIESLDMGKVLRVAQEISLQSANLDDTDIAEWAGVLRTRRSQNALASTQRRSRDLAERLTMLQGQRAQLENDLQRSKSLNETLTLLSLVASKTDNAVLIMDGNGLVTWANDAFMRMTGYAMRDAAGVRPDQLLGGPQTSRESIHEFEQAFKLGHSVAEEFLQYRREGTTSWISLSLTPVYDDAGGVSRWIGIGSDITKRKEAERALQVARDAAETASKLKGDFLANISHEIRTPMNAIIGMTDLTLCTTLDDDQRDYLSTVKQSAESLLELLNDVLDLSKIESGRMEISEVPFNLHSLVEETIKPLAFVAQQKDLRLSFNVAEDAPSHIVGDPLRLRQILINLVGNAIKFTDQGTVEVTVVKQWEADGEVGMQFTVADTGVGIRADKLDQIFEAFSQADASVTRQYGGTGLGLAITSELLRMMKGRVWVQSEPGAGSRFHFTLKATPASTTDIANLEAKKSESPTLGVPVSSVAKSRPLDVLVADDHPANRKLIARILQKRGHRIRFAKNGHEVLAMFDQHEFDVVLLDVQMPEMGGLEATTAIRELEGASQRHVPIIAVTAHAMQSDREACLAVGMDAYLSKPISAMDLVALVDSLADNHVNQPLKPAATSQSILVIGDTQSQQQQSVAVLIAEIRTSPKPFAGTLQRFDNDEEILLEQMQFFLNDGPMLLQMVATAVQENNAGSLAIAAHRLKNLCATFDDAATALQWGEVESMKSNSQTHLHATLVGEANAGTKQLLHSVTVYLNSQQ